MPFEYDFNWADLVEKKIGFINNDYDCIFIPNDWTLWGKYSLSYHFEWKTVINTG